MTRAALLCLTVLLAEPVAAQTHPRAVIEAFFEAYRALDVEKTAALFAPEIAFEDPTARLRANGRAELRKMAEGLRATYKDIGIEVHSLIASGEQVSAEVTMSGTVIRKDGSTRKFRVRGASFFRVRNGQIVRWTDYFDVQTLNDQLRGPAPQP